MSISKKSFFRFWQNLCVTAAQTLSVPAAAKNALANIWKNACEQCLDQLPFKPFSPVISFCDSHQGFGVLQGLFQRFPVGPWIKPNLFAPFFKKHLRQKSDTGGIPSFKKHFSSPFFKKPVDFTENFNVILLSSEEEKFMIKIKIFKKTCISVSDPAFSRWGRIVFGRLTVLRKRAETLLALAWQFFFFMLYYGNDRRRRESNQNRHTKALFGIFLIVVVVLCQQDCLIEQKIIRKFSPWSAQQFGTSRSLSMQKTAGNTFVFSRVFPPRGWKSAAANRIRFHSNTLIQTP